MSNLSEDASACLSLAYKYGSLIGCVEDQRAQLLSDPHLSMIKAQRDALEELFAARVRELADGAESAPSAADFSDDLA